ncbi:hypothetical protein E2542_SST08695 [Spatholobus suberectus]|nr:hypothetical protein E2542_SST08695 [Spatholobus suberectus]
MKPNFLPTFNFWEPDIFLAPASEHQQLFALVSHSGNCRCKIHEEVKGKDKFSTTVTIFPRFHSSTLTSVELAGLQPNQEKNKLAALGSEELNWPIEGISSIVPIIGMPKVPIHG